MADKSKSNSDFGIYQFPNQEDGENAGVSNFQFVVFQDPKVLKSKGTQQALRSYRTRKYMEAKKRRLEETGANFQLVTYPPVSPTLKKPPMSPRQSSIAISELDPFETLAINAKRLQSLIQHKSAPQALEPVCNLTDHSSHQKFYTVFQSGFHDPALSSAVIMALALAENGHQITKECLEYQTNALSLIKQRIGDRVEYSIPATLGAILLLIGVEWRLGAKCQVQIHLKGLLNLLHICDAERIHLHDGIKRAAFWQDLFAALITGSERMLNHDVFPELMWKRDPFLSSVYTLPLGFHPLSNFLGSHLIETIEDLHALQHTRETLEIDASDPISVIHVDNHQAWTESRLYNCLYKADPNNGMLTGCIIALFLCTYMLFTGVWGSPFIPSQVSGKLLRTLRRMDKDTSWIGQEGVLLWCVMVGGTFSQPGAARSEFVSLFQRLRIPARPSSWPDMEAFLKTFIWSSKLFGSLGKAFWNTVSLSISQAEDDYG